MICLFVCLSYLIIHSFLSIQTNKQTKNEMIFKDINIIIIIIIIYVWIKFVNHEILTGCHDGTIVENDMIWLTTPLREIYTNTFIFLIDWLIDMIWFDLIVVVYEFFFSLETHTHTHALFHWPVVVVVVVKVDHYIYIMIIIK